MRENPVRDGVHHGGSYRTRTYNPLIKGPEPILSADAVPSVLWDAHFPALS